MIIGGEVFLISSDGRCPWVWSPGMDRQSGRKELLTPLLKALVLLLLLLCKSVDSVTVQAAWGWVRHACQPGIHGSRRLGWGQLTVCRQHFAPKRSSGLEDGRTRRKSKIVAGKGSPDRAARERCVLFPNNRERNRKQRVLEKPMGSRSVTGQVASDFKVEEFYVNNFRSH